MPSDSCARRLFGAVHKSLSDKFHLSSGGGVSELLVFSRNLKFVVKTMIQSRCDGACKHIKLKSCRFHAVKMMVRQIKWIHATEMNLFVKEIKYCL